MSERNSRYVPDRSDNRSQFSLYNSRKGMDFPLERDTRSEYGGGGFRKSINSNILDSEIMNSSHSTIQTQFLNLEN